MLLALLLATLTKSIASGNQAWIDAMKAHDAARIAATYDADAVNCSPSGECAHGRAEIEKQMAERFAKLGPVTDAWVKSAHTARDGALAYEWGRAGFRSGGKDYAARYLTTWRKQNDGSWKIFRNLVLP